MASKEEIKSQVSEGFNEAANILTSVVECLNENPELEECAADLFQKYANILSPMFRNLMDISVEARKQAFIEFHDMGLSDELAVKMVCGR